jgi:hypothetical protein
MQDRLKFRLNYSLPGEYQIKDFSDIIEASLPKTGPNYIELRCIDFEKEFERFGKKFKIHIFAIFGQVYITITQLS